MTSTPAISDTAVYNARMAKSLIDKIFFLDKIEVDTILDFGCADGTLLDAIRHFSDRTTLLGYDIDPLMVAKAREKNPVSTIISDDWDEILSKCTGRKAIVLSSLIHEVYSYGSENDVKIFWNRIFNSGFDYVVIRDMGVSKTASRPSDPLSVARVRQLADPVLLQEWESYWGSISENWSLIHWFLTYKYTNNWDREIRENYLPIPVEDIIRKAPKEYVPTFYEHYTLPWLRNEVMNDFGIQLQERTHIKIIFQKH